MVEAGKLPRFVRNAEPGRNVARGAGHGVDRDFRFFPQFPDVLLSRHAGFAGAGAWLPKGPQWLARLCLPSSFWVRYGCWFGGGGQETVPPTITSVSVSCTPSDIQTGQTSQCSATVSGSGSYNSSVTWSATNGTITRAGVFTPRRREPGRSLGHPLRTLESQAARR